MRIRTQSYEAARDLIASYHPHLDEKSVAVMARGALTAGLVLVEPRSGRAYLIPDAQREQHV